MLLLYVPVALVALYYGLYYYFTRNYNYWKQRSIIGPEPIPLFGNIKDSTLRKKNMAVVFQEYYNMYPEEKVVGVYRMTTPCLLIRDLDVIRHIMIKDFDVFRDRGIDFSNYGLGQNMFHADGEMWSALRTQFSPIFTSGKLKNMFRLLNERADLFINHLAKRSQINAEYDVRSLVQKYTISTIFACAFGVDFDNFSTELDDSLKSLDEMILTPNFAYTLDMMYPGLLKKLDLSIFPANVRHFFDQLVSDIILQRNGTPSDRGDFMDLILQLREKGVISTPKRAYGIENKSIDITDDIIAAQAFVFYIGGYETSSTTVTYLLYQIALHPEIQDQLREEIDAITKLHGKITYESLNEMKYLEKVFSETLRMYPIADPLQRKALIDYKIPGTDVVIEKDQTVLISVLGIHNDDKYYPNPEVFDPSRFDAKLVGARHPCAYLPFGIGPRYCIGMRFGSIQSRLCVAKIISKFRVEPCKNTQRSLGIEPNRNIIGPKENIYLNIVPRHL